MSLTSKREISQKGNRKRALMLILLLLDSENEGICHKMSLAKRVLNQLSESLSQQMTIDCQIKLINNNFPTIIFHTKTFVQKNEAVRTQH